MDVTCNKLNYKEIFERNTEFYDKIMKVVIG